LSSDTRRNFVPTSHNQGAEERVKFVQSLG
jgi:hypothetical protein